MPIVERAYLFCGDREWKDVAAIQLVLNSIPPRDTAIITGGARGADTIAWERARDGGFRTVRMDAPWVAFDKLAGPMLNAHAFHANIASSKGTADMLGRLRKAGVHYVIHDGR